jgi:hypothetical protein
MRKRGGLEHEKSLKSFGTTSSYGSNSTPESVEKNEKYSTENYSNQTTSTYNHYQSSSSTENNIGTVKSNYYEEVRRNQQLEQDSSFWKVLQDMLSYIYESIGVSGNSNRVETIQNPNSNASNYPEIDILIDNETM